MVGINEVLGYRYRYYDGFSDNYGFTGIAVALLGRNHPVGVMLAALLFAVLTRGGIPVDAFTRARDEGHRPDSAGHDHPVRGVLRPCSASPSPASGRGFATRRNDG